MLAKIWKKALLIICILACIYNIMHKLISRTPLELQLKSVQNQNSIVDMLRKTDKTNQMPENSSAEEKENQTLNTPKSEENTTDVTNNTIVVIY